MKIEPLALETAPEEVLPELNDAIENFGMLPNLYAGMANSPAMLATMADMPSEILEELLAGRELSDARLNAVRNMALALMTHRGWVPENELQAFIDAGYNESQLLEIITILVQKALNLFQPYRTETTRQRIFVDDLVTG